jgi:hypothetical protein
MTCERCMAEPCDRVRSTRKLLGSWARERRRQDVGLFGALKSESAMATAVDTSVKDALEAKCSCGCHERQEA